MNFNLEQSNINNIVRETVDAYINSSVNEGLIKTYPDEFVFDYIRKHYSKYLRVFTKEREQLIISIHSKSKLIPLIERDMNTFGWYCAIKCDDDKHSNCTMFVFEPKFEDKYNMKFIRKFSKYLFHVTPSYNKDKILMNGFVPKSKNSVFAYPERIYFWRNCADIDEVKQMTCLFWCRNVNRDRTDTYCLFVVDTNKINDDVTFQFDWNVGVDCMFTTDNIPKDAIVYCMDMNIPSLIQKYGIDVNGGTGSDFVNQLKQK